MFCVKSFQKCTKCSCFVFAIWSTSFQIFLFPLRTMVLFLQPLLAFLSISSDPPSVWPSLPCHHHQALLSLSSVLSKVFSFLLLFLTFLSLRKWINKSEFV